MSGMKITPWNDEQTKREVMKRFRQAQQARRRLEDQWDRNEASAFGFDSVTGNSLIVDSMGNPLSTMSDGDDAAYGATDRTNVSYTFKNLRFLHSQMSANPPTVAMRPASSDQEDSRKADAADRVSRYNIRKYQLQENTDKWTLNTLVYGLGGMKSVWDSTLGDIIEFDEAEGTMKLEGDVSVSVPHTRNLFIDADARSCGTAPETPNGVKHVIERIYMDYDLACAKWPTRSEVLQAARIDNDGNSYGNQGRANEEHYNCVELLEYWETGLPTNGYMGRYAVLTIGGEVVESCRPSPFRFPKAGSIAAILESEDPDELKEKRIAKLPQMARLPYHLLTDIDVPNSAWGKSTLEYAAPLQEVLGQIDTAYVDNIRAHGVARMVVSNQTEVNLDLSNTPWDVVKVDSNQAPFFMEVPQLMPEMTASRTNMIQGINDTMGMNESMLGQQSREQSSASMQYATNQGNMIRRRIFNKYVLGVESLHKGLLDLERKHWTIERTIRVLGKEKAFESLALKGADIDGGYDVVGEYGVTLSLDPMTRREEIMALQPMFEKAGIPTRMSLKMLKLNELEGMYDKLQMAEDRQRELFDEMIATQQLLQPEEFQDHENMIAWAMEYFMTAEFKYLDETSRQLCKEHIKLRIQQAATEKSGGLTAQPQAPGPAPAAPGPGDLPAAPAAPAPIVNG